MNEVAVRLENLKRLYDELLEQYKALKAENLALELSIKVYSDTLIKERSKV